MADPNDTPAARRELGARIQWARELVQPNRQAFARRLGVDTTTMKNIENGSRNPSIWLLQRICHTLRIDLDYVVNGMLSGIDPELRQLLVQLHPETAMKWVHEEAAKQRAKARRGNARRARLENKSPRPTTPPV